MKVGVCSLRIHIPGSRSLKDKRSVVKSMVARLQRQFNLSVAEVGDHDLWQMASIGMACVASHNHRVDDIISSALLMLERDFPDVEVVEKEIELY